MKKTDLGAFDTLYRQIISEANSEPVQGKELGREGVYVYAPPSSDGKYAGKVYLWSDREKRLVDFILGSSSPKGPEFNPMDQGFEYATQEQIDAAKESASAYGKGRSEEASRKDPQGFYRD